MLQQQESIDVRTQAHPGESGTLSPFTERQSQSPQQDTVESVDALLATLAQERRKRERLTRRYRGIALGIVALVLLCALISWIKTGRFPSDILNSFACMAGLAGITAATTRDQKTEGP